MLTGNEKETSQYFCLIQHGEYPQITMAKTADENFKQGEEFIQTFHREDLGYDGCIKGTV